LEIEALREFCLSFNGAAEDTPFGNSALVFKVRGKMFALLDIENFDSINLKCDPTRAVELREEWPAVRPGYHMNKRHWNTVMLDGSVPDGLLRQWIGDSYKLVVAGLPKNQREGL
jgi:predicted DNA-binding protein (MmcQ/YjbR family)